MTDIQPTTSAEMLSMFLAWMRSRAMSQNTIDRRTVSLRGFLAHIEPMTLASVEAVHVEEWLTTKRAPSTRHAYRSDLSSFYKWAVRRHLLDRNPVADTDSIRVPKALPKPLPTDRIWEVVHCARQDVRTALLLAIYAGLRCSEIARLTTTDTQHGMLVVRKGKGGKDRTVPMHPALVTKLATLRLPQGARYVSVSAHTLSRNTAAHLRAHGIDATLHCGRHSFGTELARVSHDVMLVGQLMGHESPTTTMGYVRLNAPGGEAVGDMFGPDAA